MPVAGSTAVDLALEDLRPGMYASYDAQLPRKAVEAFATLTGDASPLHVDPEYGAASTFNGNVVHGMLLAGHLSTLVGMFLPGRRALLSSIEVNFHRPVPVDATVTFTARIIAVRIGTASIVLGLTAVFDDSPCLSGRAIVKVRDN